MLSRRSMFSLFAGVGAIAAGAKVVEAKPIDVTVDVKWVPSSDPRPRVSHYTGLADAHSHANTMSDPTHSHGYTCTMRQYQAGECLPTEESLGMMFPRGMLVSGAGLVQSIADGEGGIVPVASPEGQAILKSIATPNTGMSRW